MLDAIIEGLIGGLIGNAIARRRERRKAERRQVKFAVGADVRMHCSLRRPTESAGWSHGLLTLSSTQAVWRARLKRGEPVTVSPATASYLDQHPATPTTA
ncbi:hypothetical protein [Kutzneria kofuensis]|uniref:Uncharacterized protein n=1 Tax=Kutzneria kofuensis TaxID=103725 RepID=A0A7W9NIW9_9PSEU|nr:hypothetical protein [Kutzneria kofuensis]MBB5893528.1 hypothetical protein [Kutzneria kofuensis]